MCLLGLFSLSYILRVVRTAGIVLSRVNTGVSSAGVLEHFFFSVHCYFLAQFGVFYFYFSSSFLTFTCY